MSFFKKKKNKTLEVPRASSRASSSRSRSPSPRRKTRSRSGSGAKAPPSYTLKELRVLLERHPDPQRLSAMLQSGSLPVSSRVFYKQCFTPLLLACRSGADSALLSLLLEGGSDPSQPRPSDGATPLLCCARHGSEDSVRLLLRCPGIDVDAQDCWGDSALFAACSLGRAGVVRALLDAGADPNAGDCLLACMARGHLKCALLLLRCGRLRPDLLREAREAEPGAAVLLSRMQEEEKEEEDPHDDTSEHSVENFL